MINYPSELSAQIKSSSSPMDIFPPSFWDMLYDWEVLIFLFLSLFVQLLLLPMGLKRKHSSSQFLRFFLSFSYSFASWITNFSFGLIVTKNDSDCYSDSSESTCIIRAFFAPFLLLHLGGSDTINAYSTEDNDLWFRALLSMIAQLFASFYISLLAFKPNSLNYVAIPVFVSGIIKYGEKILALRSASSERLRDLLAVSTPSPITTHQEEEKVVDLQMLHTAYYFFKRDKRLFVGLGPTSSDLQQNRLCYYDNFDSKCAFKIIELELGFMYDFLYTKASINHSLWGRLLRLTSISSLVIAIVTYSMTLKQMHYSQLFVCLVFILFFGALVLEIYSLFLFLLSDWNVIWLTTQSPSFPLPHLAFKLISHCGWSVRKRRCSNSIFQHNLMSHCLKQRNQSYYSKFFSNIKTIAAPSVQPISKNLETQIFEQLKQDFEGGKLKQECRGNNEVGWSLKLDLDETILLWHIATDICYRSSEVEQGEEVSKSSVLLSNFLAYILAHRPSLFCSGMSKTRLKATSDHVLEFLQNKKMGSDTCRNMLKIEVEEERSNSMLYESCRLARQLEEVGGSKKWKIIKKVWVELLARVALECEWYDHANHLRQGGNLLTSVRIWMHHLGYIKPPHPFTMEEDEQDTPLPVLEVLSHCVVDVDVSRP